MCGRYASSRSSTDLSALFEAHDDTGGVVARYNLAPTDPAALVRRGQGRAGRVLSVGRWGLFGSARMINARAETVTTTRAYAPAFASRRALVPADGWYEWRREQSGHRQPYFMCPADGSVLALAGLWTATAQGVTFTVVTTAAVGSLAQVHDRMPLLLSPQGCARWLDEDPADAAELLTTPASEVVAGLEVRPVGAAVGNVRNDGPHLIERVEPVVPEGLW